MKVTTLFLIASLLLASSALTTAAAPPKCKAYTKSQLNTVADCYTGLVKGPKCNNASIRSLKNGFETYVNLQSTWSSVALTSAGYVEAKFARISTIVQSSQKPNKTCAGGFTNYVN